VQIRKHPVICGQVDVIFREDDTVSDVLAMAVAISDEHYLGMSPRGEIANPCGRNRTPDDEAVKPLALQSSRRIVTKFSRVPSIVLKGPDILP
jgi:hypothetical protein